MDLKGYKVRNTTKCECGYEFDIRNMQKLQRISDSKFYGGAIRHVDEIKCPRCKQDTLLLIKQTGQTYIVKDIAQKDNNVIVETPKIENKAINNTNNENICYICKRSFKSKSGLTSHLRTHSK